MWRDLLASRELGWRLFVRSFSARYRRSVFGMTWAFLPPILTGLFFILLQSRKVVHFGDTDIPYPVFVLTGMMLWQIFLDALNSPLEAWNDVKAALPRIYFPREAVIVSALLNVISESLIKLIVLAGILVFFGVSLSPAALCFPALLIILILLGLTIGLVFTVLGQIYSDFLSCFKLIQPVWFFLTPVVYPPPEVFPFSLITIFNPVSPLLTALRTVLADGAIVPLAPLAIVSILTLAGFYMGWIFYRISVPFLIERMNA